MSHTIDEPTHVHNTLELREELQVLVGLGKSVLLLLRSVLNKFVLHVVRSRPKRVIGTCSCPLRSSFFNPCSLKTVERNFTCWLHNAPHQRDTPKTSPLHVLKCCAVEASRVPLEDLVLTRVFAIQRIGVCLRQHGNRQCSRSVANGKFFASVAAQTTYGESVDGTQERNLDRDFPVAVGCFVELSQDLNGDGHDGVEIFAVLAYAV